MTIFCKINPGFWADVGGENKGSNVWQSVRTIVYK